MIDNDVGCLGLFERLARMSFLAAGLLTGAFANLMVRDDFFFNTPLEVTFHLQTENLSA